MNKGKKKLMLIILALALCVFLAGCKSEDSQDDELSRLREEAKALETAQENLQAQINQAEAAWRAYEYYSSQLP